MMSGLEIYNGDYMKLPPEEDRKCGHGYNNYHWIGK